MRSIVRGVAVVAAACLGAGGLLVVTTQVAGAATLTVPGGYPTIQAAINAASPGDTIDVAPGTYAETLTITTDDLTIDGANAGVDPNTQTRGPESIIEQPATATKALITATNVSDLTLDGFTLTDASSRNAVLPAVTLTGSSGNEIDYDIVSDNGTGIGVANQAVSDPDTTSIDHDQFVENNNDPTSTASGVAIYAINVANNVTVSDNGFQNNANQAVSPGYENGVINTEGCNFTPSDICTGWTITGNSDTADSSHANNFAVLQALSDPTVEDNDVTFTSPTNAAVPAIYVDTGTTGGTISSNDVSGDTNQAAIYVDNVFRSGGTNVTFSGNDLTDNQYGIWVATDGNPDLYSPYTDLQITDNTITDSTVQALNLWSANGFSVTGNMLTDNAGGAVITGGSAFDYTDNTVTSTSVIPGSDGIGVNGGAGYVISGNTITRQDYGVFLFTNASSNFTISSNTVMHSSSGGMGVGLGASTGGTFLNNTTLGTSDGYDAFDAVPGSETQGTIDTWTNTNCHTSNPYGLCPVGYWLGAQDGGVFSFGSAKYMGSEAGQPLNAPMVGIMGDPQGSGYWLCGGDGGIFTFGPQYYGSMGGRPLNAPIVACAATSDGKGYWLTGADGGVFNFGDAGFYGSLGGTPLNKPIVAMEPVPGGGGYYLIASDGGVFTFGSAVYRGTTLNPPSPIVGMGVTADNGGYWQCSANGGISTYGDANNYGSLAGQTLPAPIVGFQATPDGKGYWMVGADGSVYAFGDAVFAGDWAGQPLVKPMDGMTL